MYEPISKKARAAQYRADAIECERRGYPGFAAVNRELADWIDPPPREAPEAPRRRAPEQSPRVSRGPDPSRLNGQRDLPPKRVARAPQVPQVRARPAPLRVAAPRVNVAPRAPQRSQRPVMGVGRG